MTAATRPPPAKADPEPTLPALLALQDEASTRQYFRDLAGSRPMTAEQEASLAHTIEERHAAIWEQLLTYMPLALPLIDRALDAWPRGPGLRKLRGAAHDAAVKRTAGARRELVERAPAVALALCRHDRDRILLAELLARVDAAARESVPPGGRAAFAHFVHELRQAQAAADGARQEFVRHNLRLVVSVARRYRRSGTPFADLIQDGNLGLLKAVDRYDVRRGFRFSTYASWWIRHAIGRALADRGRLVRQPVHRIQTRAQLARLTRQLADVLGHPPDAGDLARATGLSEERIVKALDPAMERVYSLDQPRSAAHDHAWQDSLPDTAAEERSAPELLTRRATLQQLEDAIGRLKPIEATIVRKRFGFDDEQEERTLADIGREHGLSRERVRQIEAAALQKIKRSLARAERPSQAPSPRAR